MNTLVYYFTLPAKSENPLISAGYSGLICTSSSKHPQCIVYDVLSRNKPQNDSFEKKDLTIEQINDDSDSRINLFLKERDNGEITEFAFSDNDRSFQQCTFIREFFKEREKAIKDIINGEITFEQLAYSIFSIRGYDINPVIETGESGR